MVTKVPLKVGWIWLIQYSSFYIRLEGISLVFTKEDNGSLKKTSKILNYNV